MGVGVTTVETGGRFFTNVGNFETTSGSFVTTSGGITVGSLINCNTIDTDGTGVFSCGIDEVDASDARLKTDVAELTDVLVNLAQICGVSFRWNEEGRAVGMAGEGRNIGVIAQEVEAAYPELGSTFGEQGYKAVDYKKLTAVLLEGVKELHAENEDLRARVEALEQAAGIESAPAGHISAVLSNPWLLVGGLAMGGLLLGGLVTVYRTQR